MSHYYTGEDDRCMYCDNRRYRGGPCINEATIKKEEFLVPQSEDPPSNHTA